MKEHIFITYHIVLVMIPISSGSNSTVLTFNSYSEPSRTENKTLLLNITTSNTKPITTTYQTNSFETQTIDNNPCLATPCHPQAVCISLGLIHVLICFIH